MTRQPSEANFFNFFCTHWLVYGTEAIDGFESSIQGVKVFCSLTNQCLQKNRKMLLMLFTVNHSLTLTPVCWLRHVQASCTIHHHVIGMTNIMVWTLYITSVVRYLQSWSNNDAMQLITSILVRVSKIKKCTNETHVSLFNFHIFLLPKIFIFDNKSRWIDR